MTFSKLPSATSSDRRVHRPDISQTDFQHSISAYDYIKIRDVFVGSCAPQTSSWIYFVFAALFLLTLIYFSLVLFTKTDLRQNSHSSKAAAKCGLQGLRLHDTCLHTPDCRHQPLARHYRIRDQEVGSSLHSYQVRVSPSRIPLDESLLVLNQP